MATYFWVGGTGTWNVTSTQWSTTSGGPTISVTPSSSDSVTFDGNSGGGTVTIGTSINSINTVTTITMGSFTGTLTNATNNININCATSFSLTGTGTRTLNLGTGTLTVNGVNANVWDATTVTNLTLVASQSTIVIGTPSAGQAQNFVGGGLTSYGTVTISSRTNNSQVAVSGNNTFATFNINAPAKLFFTAGNTQAVTNPVNWVGNNSTSPIFLYNSVSATNATLTISSASVISYAVIGSITFTNPVVATNSFDIQNNSNLTTSLTVGGGGSVFGS